MLLDNFDKNLSFTVNAFDRTDPSFLISTYIQLDCLFILKKPKDWYGGDLKWELHDSVDMFSSMWVLFLLEYINET